MEALRAGAEKNNYAGRRNSSITPCKRVARGHEKARVVSPRRGDRCITPYAAKRNAGMEEIPPTPSPPLLEERGLGG